MDRHFVRNWEHFVEEGKIIDFLKLADIFRFPFGFWLNCNSFNDFFWLGESEIEVVMMSEWNKSRFYFSCVKETVFLLFLLLIWRNCEIPEEVKSIHHERLTFFVCFSAVRKLLLGTGRNFWLSRHSSIQIPHKIYVQKSYCKTFKLKIFTKHSSFLILIFCHKQNKFPYQISNKYFKFYKFS